MKAEHKKLLLLGGAVGGIWLLKREDWRKKPGAAQTFADADKSYEESWTALAYAQRWALLKANGSAGTASYNTRAEYPRTTLEDVKSVGKFWVDRTWGPSTSSTDGLNPYVILMRTIGAVEASIRARGGSTLLTLAETQKFWDGIVSAAMALTAKQAYDPSVWSKAKDAVGSAAHELPGRLSAWLATGGSVIVAAAAKTLLSNPIILGAIGLAAYLIFRRRFT